MTSVFRRKINIIVAVVLTVTLVFPSFCGCSNKKDINNDADCIYDVTQVEDDSMPNLLEFKLLKSKDEIIMYGVGQDNETGLNVAEFIKLSDEGAMLSNYTYPLNEDRFIGVSLDDAGDFYFIIRAKEENKPEELMGETPEEENQDISDFPTDDSMGEEGEENRAYFYKFVKMDVDGNVCVEKNIAKDAQVASIEGIREDEFVKYIVYDQDKVFLITQDNVLIYDSNLNFESMYDKQKGDRVYKDVFDIELAYVKDRNGSVYVKYMDNSYNIQFACIDMTTGKKISGFTPLMDYRWDDYSAGENYDFYICKNSCLYGYNAGEDQPVKIIDFVLSNIVANRINSAILIGENKYMAIYSSMEDNKFHLGILKKSSASEQNSKKVITLVTTNNLSNITKAVVKFNRSNSEYCVRIVNYWELYGSDSDDFQVVVDKLNTDIISGNMPDMLLIDPAMPLSTYIGKDLIEDLKPYIENDPEIALSDYNQNVIDVFSYGGKMFTLVPGYKLSTVYVKDKYLNGMKSWNIDEAQAIWDKADTTLFMEPKSAPDFLGDCLCAASAQFVDWDECKCYFDSNEFKEFIKFADRLPKSEDEVDYSLYNEYDSWYKSDTCLCYLANTSKYGSYMAIGNFKRYAQIIHSDFNEPCTPIGFPSFDGKGNALDANMQLAMSSKSDNKEGCWQFLRYFLSEEYQNTVAKESDFPIMNKVMEKCLKEAQEPLYNEYEDMDGTIYREPLLKIVNGEQVPVEPLTEKEANDFMDVLNSVTRTTHSDPKIMKIVDEEYQEYLAGRSTMDEMTNRIQSRVQIYMYESM